MSVSANAKVILTATRELARRWDQTREQWSDAKSAEFERVYLSELFSGVERAGSLMEELDRLIASVKNQCE